MQGEALIKVCHVNLSFSFREQIKETLFSLRHV